MRTLQSLLTILGGQQLAPGYLTPLGPTALEHMIALKRQLDTVTINKGSYQPAGSLLFAEAWVASLRAGQDAIYLADVDGNLNKANGPAYIFQSSSALAGWSIAQSKYASIGSSAAPTIALSGNTTTGNTLIVVALTTGAGTSVSGITINSGSAAFTKRVALISGTLNVEIWSASGITGGVTPTVTVNLGGTASNSELVVYEATGGAGTAGPTNSNSGSSTALSTGAITPTTNGNLIVKVFKVSGSCNGVVQAGWTEFNPTTVNANAVGYIVQGTAGSITGTDTQTPTNSYIGAIAAFQP